MLRYLVFLLIVSAVSCQRRKAVYKPCGGSGKLISRLRFEPCDSDPCVFKKGYRYQDSRHQWLLTRTATTATLDARVKVFGFQMPVPGIETDLCKGHRRVPRDQGYGRTAPPPSSLVALSHESED
uniref:Putative major epididymal secretory protein he1 n=1 Tax=Ixodes ricinus TaxID=34613 RepID=A0A090XAM9_IXORI